MRTNRTGAALALVTALIVSLVAGCSGGGAAGHATDAALRSGATAAPLDPALARALVGYHRYVSAELTALVTRTKTFAAAIDAGRRRAAQRLYPIARTHYERIEPVAEAWGSLDLAIDGRIDDFASPAQFSGFHRLEQLLWSPTTAGPGPAVAPGVEQRVAAALVTNVEVLQRRARAIPFTTLQMSSGATELLNEIEASKITGEEERYSHLDLVDIVANVEGCDRIVGLFAGYLRAHSPDLLHTIDARIDRVRSALDRYRTHPGADDSGYPSYRQLSRQQRRGLSGDVTALAEAVSLITDATSR